jgi:hypothetical protein
MTNDKQPSFADRCKRVAEIADALDDMRRDLTDACEFLTDEAERMAAAQQRFTERRADRRKPGK